MNTPNAPWLKFYGDIPKTLEYPQISMYEAVVNAGKTHSQVNAYEFQGKGTTYAKFIEKIDRTAKAYKALGIKEGETVTIIVRAEDELPLSVEMPSSVVLEVTQTEPGVKGNTATNATKPATVETGASVNVPLFINEGDKIKIETDKGSYQERVTD